jgi:hypothetical protein
MASTDSLNDRQRAILQLLLRKGKSYEDLAGLLKIEPANVRSRAREAVAAVGPDSSAIGTERRDEICDYLLGQQTALQRAATREYLQGSSAGRSWARAAATALAPLDGETLPDIPVEREEVADAPEEVADAPDRGASEEEVKRSSKLGTRLLLAGVGVILGIAVILAIGLGSGDEPGSTATTTTTGANVQTTPTGDEFQVVAQGTLAPPKNVESRAKGQVAIVRFPDNNQFRLAVQATGLRPISARGSAYGVWLYTSDDKKQFLGFPDATVGRDGKLQTVSDLSPETPAYAAVLLTREKADKPTRPGAVVLIAPMVTAADAQAQQRTQTQTTP